VSTLGSRLLGLARGAVPAAVLPSLARVRARAAWRQSEVRADALEQMRFLLEKGVPEADLEQVARAYVEFQVYRGELRWHPDQLTRFRVVGADHLRDARAKGRGAILNFMHHGHYDGAFASLAVRHGQTCQIVVYPYMLEPTAAPWLKQHVKVSLQGGGVAVSAAVGTGGMLSLLARGQVVAIASDVPGRTPVRFAGRDVLGSYGAARLAFDAGSPIVAVTTDRDAQGAYIRVHPPLQPAGFDSPRALLEHTLAVHEESVLAWPEATDLPLSRWGTAQ
jgi:lauroyl/myristoyl acyltransferase